MTELGKEELIRILTEPKNAIVKQYQEMFKLEGVDLHFTKEALGEIAEEAVKRKTGARSEIDHGRSAVKTHVPYSGRPEYPQADLYGWLRDRKKTRLWSMANKKKWRAVNKRRNET